MLRRILLGLVGALLAFGPAEAIGVWTTYSSTLPDGTVLCLQTTSGAFSCSIPGNAPGFVDIEISACGGSGGLASSGVGGGGGGGAYVKKHMAVTPGSTVLSGSVCSPGARAHGASPANGHPGTSTTITSPALTANGGGAGLSTGTDGAGGSASGGDTNLAGGSGSGGDGGAGAGPAGGAIQSTEATSGNSLGGGGSGGNTLTDSLSGPGAPGQIKITARAS